MVRRSLSGQVRILRLRYHGASLAADSLAPSLNWRHAGAFLRLIIAGVIGGVAAGGLGALKNKLCEGIRLEGFATVVGVLAVGALELIGLRGLFRRRHGLGWIDDIFHEVGCFFDFGFILL